MPEPNMGMPEPHMGMLPKHMRMPAYPSGYARIPICSAPHMGMLGTHTCMLEQHTRVLMECSAESEEAQVACKVELQVVKHRLSAAQHVMGSSKAATASKAAMDTYIKSFGRSGAASDAGSTSVAQPASSSASNELALRCGPCLGFQNLQH